MNYVWYTARPAHQRLLKQHKSVRNLINASAHPPVFSRDVRVRK